MQSDVLSDALSAMKNAFRSGKRECEIRPSSKMVRDVLLVMQKNGYVGVFEEIEDGRGGSFKVTITELFNDTSSVKPRVLVKKVDFLHYEKRFLPAREFGLLILSTSQGVMAHTEAKKKGIGGALLAYVF